MDIRKANDAAEYHLQQIEEAKAAGLIVVEPAPNELFLDLDDTESEATLYRLLPILVEHLEGEVVTVAQSKGGNKHAYLRVKRELSDIERIALQACLGSDRKRELLGFVRAISDVRPVTVFFEEPKTT